MNRVETYKTTLVIKVNEEEIELNINTSIARGWRELQDAIAKEVQESEEIKKALEKDPTAGAALFITREAENARLYIDAIRLSLASSEYEKISGIIEYLDIRGLRAIAVEIINRYTAYYDERVKEFKE